MRVAMVWGCLVLVAACAVPKPVPPEMVAQETRRFLEPFVAGHNVACDELLVEITGNFAANVGRPAVDENLHRMSQREGDGYSETRWVSLHGDPPGAFTVAIGETDRVDGDQLVPGRVSTFTVLRSVRIRIFEGTHEWALRVTAQGNVFALEAGADRDLEEFRVVDGVLHRQ